MKKMLLLLMVTVLSLPSLPNLGVLPARGAAAVGATGHARAGWAAAGQRGGGNHEPRPSGIRDFGIS